MSKRFKTNMFDKGYLLAQLKHFSASGNTEVKNGKMVYNDLEIFSITDETVTFQIPSTRYRSKHSKVAIRKLNELLSELFGKTIEQTEITPYWTKATLKTKEGKDQTIEPDTIYHIPLKGTKKKNIINL